MTRNKAGNMTLSDLPFLEQVTQKLHAEGGRMTSQRRIILEALGTCPDHPTAEEIYLRARESDESLHLSTVYRTLRWLEEEGFVSPRWFEDEHRQERFDTTLDGNGDHHHFRCRVCNAIIEFHDPLIEDIKAAYQARSGGRIENATLILYGVCQHCGGDQNNATIHPLPL
jgi:Fur family ferric uptake transcriptional regulator/Fur family peroxide stress response transcriptional regulator